MPPTNLQGLNIVHPAPAHDADLQDLVSSPHFPDLVAQLDIWSNLAFQSDEPLIRNDHEQYPNSRKYLSVNDDTEDDVSPVEGSPIHDGRVNLVPDRSTLPTSHIASNGGGSSTSFDNFISGLSPNNFSIPSNQSPVILGSSLAQLLALQGPAYASPPSAGESSPHNETTSPPPFKRVRTRKLSVSTVDESENVTSSTLLTAAEDKRRRNTAASARFRLKKKEREAALETKAKELEVKVTELERECESLRRENGWLKGLVVGVTGAAQQPATATAMTKATTGTVTTTTAKDESQGEM